MAFPLRLLRVRGESMAPKYHSGDFIVTSNAGWQPGDDLVFHQPGYGLLIKRLQRSEPGGLYLLGTGEDSTDSRMLGLIDPARVIGKVIHHIRRR